MVTQSLGEYKVWLKEQIWLLTRSLEAVESYERRRGATSAKPPEIGQKQAIAPTVPDADFKGLPPQEGVEKLLSMHPTKHFRAVEVTRKLRALGVSSESKTFDSTVAAALRRLERKKILLTEKKGGSRFYWFKPATVEEAPKTDQ